MNGDPGERALALAELAFWATLAAAMLLMMAYMAWDERRVRRREEASREAGRWGPRGRYYE